MVVTMVISFLLLVLSGGLAMLGILQQRLYNQQISKQQALHIAEAGANYYRWHLAHAQNDYMDGTGSDPGGGGAPYGPYVHNYSDPTGVITGKFQLDITPPPVGSTIVRVKATGWTDKYPQVKRTLEIRYGIPSLAHYSFFTSADAWFGASETVIGEMHANGGVRMDGSNDSVIASARQNFTCTSSFGCSGSGTCQSPCNWIATSTSCNCPGIFGAGASNNLWQFPVPQIQLSGITADLDAMRAKATSSGSYFKANGSTKGYHVTFNAAGTFTIRTVTSLMSAVNQYGDDWNNPAWVNYAEQYNAQGTANTYSLPAAGVIFIEDGDAWVDGTVKGRVTLVAASLPDQVNKRRTIFINNNLQYLSRNGDNVLGLIAQKDIRVPRYAPDNLIIDAILLAQWGRVYRNVYSSPSIKTSIEVYGGIITNLTWTWTWVNGASVKDGYTNTRQIYDSNVTYSPPPSFPTSGEYAFISWEEK